jgi:hypothetical protein
VLKTNWLPISKEDGEQDMKENTGVGAGTAN